MLAVKSNMHMFYMVVEVADFKYEVLFNKILCCPCLGKVSITA